MKFKIKNKGSVVEMDHDAYDIKKIKRPVGNPNLGKIGRHFTSENNRTQEQIDKAAESKKKSTKRRRDLAELLDLSLKGTMAEDMLEDLKGEFDSKPRSLLEAMHFVQIKKALKAKDTFAFSVLMQAAGLNKTRVDHTTGDKPLNSPAIDYTKYDTEDLLALKKIHQKYANDAK